PAAPRRRCTTPMPRARLLLHLACGAPFAVLGVWFGVLDQPAAQSRCASCGVEAYVTVAHVAAALWLGATIAVASARASEERRPSPATTSALILAGIAVVVGLTQPAALTPWAVASMAASVVLYPVSAVWWLAAPLVWRRR